MTKQDEARRHAYELDVVLDQLNRNGYGSTKMAEAIAWLREFAAQSEVHPEMQCVPAVNPTSAQPEAQPARHHSTNEFGDCPPWCEACRIERLAREAQPAVAAMPNQRLVTFNGVDPLEPTRGAVVPMLRDSWRFGFWEADDGLHFGFRDAGPLVALDAAEPAPQSPMTKEWCRDYPESAAYIINEFARRLDAEAAQPGQARIKCEDCDGAGRVGDEIPMGEFQPPEPDLCQSCGGSGWAFKPRLRLVDGLCRICYQKKRREEKPT